MKGGDILDFLKGENLRKEGGGVDLEKKGRMTTLTNYAGSATSFKLMALPKRVEC